MMLFSDGEVWAVVSKGHLLAGGAVQRRLLCTAGYARVYMGASPVAATSSAVCSTADC